jgi:Xaa-Pro aminopeptidase
MIEAQCQAPVFNAGAQFLHGVGHGVGHGE